MPLGSVLVHTAVRLREVAESGEYVEGEPPETKPTEGPPFDCFLILPRGGSEANVPRGRRVVDRPVILYEPLDQTGADLSLDAADEVLITAEELFGSEPKKYQIDGDPTPLAKPGFVVGFEAALKRVDD